MLERTMRRIHATLNDAEQLWDIREETTKLQLKELKELAYDMEDVVDEYEYEVNRCKVEALELSASAASNKRKHQTVTLLSQQFCYVFCPECPLYLHPQQKIIIIIKQKKK